MNKLIIKQGRERSLLHGHPWLFSGAVQRVEGNPQPGTRPWTWFPPTANA